MARKGWLALIGLGVGCDITQLGLTLAREADEVYSESHTGILPLEWKERVEGEIGKGMIMLERERLESDFIIKRAGNAKVALLVAGDPLAATTHYTHIHDGKEAGVEVKVVHNSSIFSVAPGISGLQHYKFGKTATLAYWRKNYEPVSALEIIEGNLKNGMHTLLLLDLDKELGPMTSKTAFSQISAMEKKLGRKIVDRAVVLSRAGWEDESVRYGSVDELEANAQKLGKPPFCLVIPGKLHFSEEENLEALKI